MTLKNFLLAAVALMCNLAFATAQNYVAPDDAGVYRIINLKYNLAMAQDFTGGGMICDEIGDDNAYTQLWQLTKKGTGWTFRNVYTGDYIKGAGAFYNQVMTTATATTYYLKENSLKANSYNMWHNTSQSYSLHCDNDNNIVPWYRGSDEISASEWGFVKVALSDSTVEAARAKYQAYKNIIGNSDGYCNGYMSFYTDAACTALKPEYASLTDAELSEAMSGYSDDLIAVALKIKNNNWKEYEKEFRIHTYEPYSDVDVWAKRLIMTQYSYLSNPTGIYGNSGDLIYVFVGEDIPEDASLQIDRVYMNAISGTRTELKKGMNIIPVGRGNSMLYILYTVDTTGEKLLADYDSLDIHIEGGVLNGYWDRDRHTDADWVKITRNLATYKYIQVKGHKVMLNMDKAALTASNCVPEKITECIGWWDTITEWMHELMGFEMDGTLERFNNLHVARTRDDATTMSSGSYNTNYPPKSLAGMMSYEKMMDGCYFWGPAHEIGHANQKAINMIGNTEVSNNLFSNMVLYKLGRYMSRGGIISETSANYENRVPYSYQFNVNLMHTTRMFWQLYMYYYVVGNDPQFFQKVFISLRNDPMKRSTSSLNYGSNDLLKFVEKCCEAAQEDLTTFFDAWGFFVPMNNLLVDDYGEYKLTSTAAMIKSTKEKIAQYPKKCGAIEFIEDRIANYPRTDGVDGVRLPIDYNVGETGDVGQFTAYLPDSIGTKASGYIYSKFGGKVVFSKGTGAVGFRFYSMEDSLLSFCNTYEYTLPDDVAKRELKMVAVSADGSESEVVSVYNGSEEDQLAALNEAIELAAKYVKLKDATGKKVGYYYAYAVDSLSKYYNAAKAAVTNSDQSEHTYGEWASILADEFQTLLKDNNAIIKISPKNYYRFNNASYIKYSALLGNNGVMSCALSTGAGTRFAFVPIAGSDMFYLKNINGNYIDYVSQSKDVTAKATSTSSAAKFKLHDMGEGKYAIQKENSGYGYLHCTSSYKLVGWSNDNNTSRWTIICMEDNQGAEYKEAFEAVIAEAANLVNEIVDTAKTTANGIVLYEYVVPTDDRLAEYVAQLMSEIAAAEALCGKGPAVLFPDAGDKLAEVAALVKGAYTIATGIENITIDEALASCSPVYDMNGRRVTDIASGNIYIVNGKKVRIIRK